MPGLDPGIHLAMADGGSWIAAEIGYDEQG
jgi:hypothetical protein